jgi:hypothetical protein
MIDLHVAYFAQADGSWIREAHGLVEAPDLDPTLMGEARLGALNAWQQRVAPAGRGEVGLDVTGFGWPLGQFRYCRFDIKDRRLDWGPPRAYIEIDLRSRMVVANVRTHLPIVPAVPGQVILDITGTAWEPYHGRVFGVLTRTPAGWMVQPGGEPTPALAATVLPTLPALARPRLQGARHG